MSIYDRITGESWCFGLLLTTGRIMGVVCIDGDLGEYLEVTMMDIDLVCSMRGFYPELDIFGSPTDRVRALVRKEAVVSIFELAGV